MYTDIKLFDEKQRTLEGPAKYNADPYEYYNNSIRPEVGRVREIMESWFQEYPYEEKTDLKSRFQASFDAAFFELFIYTIFTRLGYNLQIHPELPESLKRPDYLATKDGNEIYIEVKHLTTLTQLEQAAERKKNVVLDSIDRVDSSKFLLMLDEITFKDGSQPSGKGIIKYFDNELSKIDADEYTKLLTEHGFDGINPIVYDDDKITIKVKLLPKVLGLRGTKSRSIGTHPVKMLIGNDSDNIKSALQVKATKYGDLNKPFIICINKQSVGLDIFEVNESLYGSLTYSWSTDPENRDEKLTYDGTGLFGNRNNPRFTRLSGVYFTNCNTANLCTTAEHVFKHNLFAKHPVQLTLNNPIKELLGLNHDYPFDFPHGQ